MGRKQRKEIMEKAGVTQAAIARDLGVSEATVSLVVKGTCVSRRIEDEIAKRCGVSRDYMWPR